jgi:hypothetical protein
MALRLMREGDDDDGWMTGGGGGVFGGLFRVRREKLMQKLAGN